MRFGHNVFLSILLFAGFSGSSPLPVAAEDSSFPEPHNSQELTAPLLTPEEARDALRLPSGFQATLFAAEPDVQQPIAMTFDGAGRLWVAENYTYAERALNNDLRLRDRIVVFEDADGDGRADRRRVFWDEGQRLTSVEVGFGGVWALCPPNLLFIPDRDGDAVPDGPPVVILDGWSADEPRHNFVNGLRWGPDGWLYGRHGITDTSFVGKPGTPAAERVAMNCSIWRLHPVTRQLEVVCHGTTNPWGMDWNDHGELFFINTVIGHLWHAVPGSHFQRMYGEDFNPHLYRLMGQTADHFHWDTAETWSDVQRGLSESSSRHGGGHAHCGMMIYLGDDWPDRYRNELFTLNLHGRRVNRDSLERQGATYVGRHRDDFLYSDDIWFRGIELSYGPGGGVYVLDWSDLGECHENDGVHRTSGRIYKVRWSAEPQAAVEPIDQRGDVELVRLQLHQNDWYVRQARRVLQERAAAGADLAEARDALFALYRVEARVTRRLRALWCLHVTGGLDTTFLLEQLGDADEHIRAWAVRLLMEAREVDDRVAASLLGQAASEQSGLVLTYLASALQTLPAEHVWAVASRLVEHDEFAEDPVLPLLTWYGVEPVVVANPAEAVQLAGRSRWPLLPEFTARRIAYELDRDPAALDTLVRSMLRDARPAYRRSVLRGISRAVRGRLSAEAPPSWEALVSAVERSGDAELLASARSVSVVFGDGRAVDELRRLASDDQEDPETRRQAIQALVSARIPDLAGLLRRILNDRDVGAAAVRGLAATDDERTAQLLISNFRRMQRPGRAAAIETLAARRNSASRLLQGVAEGVIERHEVPAFLLRQMQLFGDPELQRQIDQLWPGLRLIAADKLQQIEHYRQQLTPETLSRVDLKNGRQVFTRLCANCHKLFGEGKDLGPELTGAQRSNLNYWLENILDPSADVATSFRMSVVVTDDGRILTGVIGEQTDRTLAIQTPTERIVLDRSTIDETRPTELSLMPDGLLADETAQQVRDLFGYLMSQ